MKTCKHCGLSNDDSSKYCFYCGKDLSENDNQVKMEFITPKSESHQQTHTDPNQCPNCKSTSISYITREKGAFKTSNGCCGVILFGPIGLLCGLTGNKESRTVKKCNKCGYEF